MSYVNVIMYGAVLPSYHSKKDSDKGINKGGKEQEIVKADDPMNRERVRKFLDEIE